MTPQELLNREPESVEKDFSYLTGCYYDFVPEVKGLYNFQETESDRIEVWIFKHFQYDYRRFWRLAAVCLDGKPVMITQNAGREGDDHARRFILDRELYMEMVSHIASLPRKPMEVDAVDDKTEFPELTDDLGDRLTSFYNGDLDGHFERSHY